MITGSWLGDAFIWTMVVIVLFSYVVIVFGDHDPPRNSPPFEPD